MLRKSCATTCKFKEAQCHKCKKVGHIAKACQTKQTFQRPRQKQPARRAKDAEPERDEQIPTKTDHDISYNLFTVAGSGQNPIIVDVIVNQTPIQMELDTLSQINKHTYDDITDHSHILMRAMYRCTPEDLYW